MSKKKFSLAEQIAALSDPRPQNIDPEDVERDLNAAKVCQYSYEDFKEDGRSIERRSLLRTQNDDWDDDPRYAGEPVSRKILEEEWGVGNLESEEEHSEDEPLINDFQLEEEEEDEDEEYGDEREKDVGKEEEKREEADDMEQVEENWDSIAIPVLSQEIDTSQIQSGIFSTVENSLGYHGDHDFTTISTESVQEDIDKGKAVKHQISMWDGLLEARIRLHKSLMLSNRLPQYDSLDLFKENGKEAVRESLKKNQATLHQLLDKLLDLQQNLLSQNTHTKHIQDSDHNEERMEDTNNKMTSEADSDEEISSDFIDSDEEDGAAVGATKNRHIDDITESGDTINKPKLSDSMEVDVDMVETHTSRRARKLKHKIKRQKKWRLENGKHDYERHILKVHEKFISYRNEIITKWNDKLKLASGKLNSKSFLHVDRSVLSHINHVLEDKQRLRKRTRLKRTAYKILGATINRKQEKLEEDESGSNSHLKNYNDEIFDDDDFYHQLLKELIERKTALTHSDDPIAMGRQWLELQKLRTKVKKKVDTKASKGRKLRYQVHQKLANFMAPMDNGKLSDTARNDLFSSLFGFRHIQ